MNIINFSFFRQNNKQKLFLMIMPLIIAVGSIIFTNYLSNKIAQNEEEKIKQWIESLKRNARLIKLSGSIFQRLTEDERNKISIFSKATQLLAYENSTETLDLLLEIIKQNENIPTISTDTSGMILDFRNVNDTNIKKGNYIDRKKSGEFFKYPPVEIHSGANTTLIYYKESNINEDVTKYVNSSSKNFLYDIETNNSSLPVMLLDDKKQILAKGNLPEEIVNDPQKLKEYRDELILENKFFDLELDEIKKLRIYYRYSFIIIQLRWFPVYLYSLMAILAFFSYVALRNTRNNEKNLIWVGMSKETAHQLGTPISSLTAWLEVFKEFENYTPSQSEMLMEMENDVNRLALIADRFSKIGSKPKLEKENLQKILTSSVDYLKQRASKKVEFKVLIDDATLEVDINIQLFEWVVENIIKNSLDALGENGLIKIVAFRRGGFVYIDFKDTGKGLDDKDFKNIFQPGFTTKKRGWGLGLSLCKRIVVEYFGGKIFVKWSKKGIGTSIRVALPHKLQ